MLKAANVKPEDVGHIHAHGLSTRSGDIDEARAIKQCFWHSIKACSRDRGKKLLWKPGAGSGMVEMISSLMAMHNDRLFPILNYETPDPECPISAVTNGSAEPGKIFINLSVTPQGQASAILIRRFEG